MCKRMYFLISFVLLLGLVQISTATDADPNHIGWWKLDETSGTTAVDSSGNGNVGTLIGDPLWVSGWIGGALDLDGDGDYVDCGNDPIFDVTDEITVAAWVTIRSIPTQWVAVVAKGEYAWRLSNDSSDPRFHFGITIWSESNPSVNGATAVGYDEWHHVAGTYDGSYIDFYLDGVLDATIDNNTGIGTNTYSVLIGENPGAAGRHWDGIIDDVRIYNRALSQAEIEALMPPQLKATVPNPSDKAIITTETVTLSWTAGETAVKHHLYIGESFEDVKSGIGGTDQGLIDQPAYDGYTWEIGKTYYWRVEEAKADGTAIHPGDVWSFTILPSSASMPVPSNGAEYVSTDVLLQWTGGAGSIEHHVYFHENQMAVLVRDVDTDMGTVEVTEFSPGPLDYNKTYYWVVDEFDGTNTYQGDVWSFTTVGPTNGAKGQYYNNANLTGTPVLTRIDPKIDFNWGTGSPHGLVSEGNFSVRWIAELDVPFTETYTFYTISDDCVRLWIDGELIIDNWTVDNAWAIEDKGNIDLVAGLVPLRMEFFNSGGDAMVQLKWQSPSIPRQIISPGALSPPLSASGEKPANGAIGVKHIPTLRWTAGDNAAYHNVYFGDDRTIVENADTTTTGIYRGQQVLGHTKYTPIEAPLEWNKTYYWRIDEVNDLHTDSLWKGKVWSFTTADYIILDDFEDYNDTSPDRIFDTWTDGWNVTTNGSQVGYGSAPFAELTIVNSGLQSMPFFYNNIGGVAYSETVRTFDAPLNDWAREGVQTLTLFFRGYPRDFFEDPARTYTMSAEGADIWDLTDEFRYAYKRLSGDGSIIARVVRVDNTDQWAKAGVMIRETLDGYSVHGFMCVTPAGRRAFQNRPLLGGESFTAGSDPNSITVPCWVKLVRQGNSITAYYSENGTNWIQQPDDENTGDDASPNPQTIVMRQDIYIGLAYCSHNTNTVGTAVFSDVTTTGTVTGDDWQVEAIGADDMPVNEAQPLYVVVRGGGVEKTVEHPDNPNAVQEYTWQQWDIPLSVLSDAGVTLSSIQNMTIGVGGSGQGGTGKLYFDDIRLYPSEE